jgi:hypothetical protein
MSDCRRLQVDICRLTYQVDLGMLLICSRLVGKSTALVGIFSHFYDVQKCTEVAYVWGAQTFGRSEYGVLPPARSSVDNITSRQLPALRSAPAETAVEVRAPLGVHGLGCLKVCG